MSLAYFASHKRKSSGGVSASPSSSSSFCPSTLSKKFSCFSSVSRVNLPSFYLMMAFFLFSIFFVSLNFVAFSAADVAAKKVSVSEVSFDSAVEEIQWCGADHRTVLLKSIKGKLYRSKDGGRQWSDITDVLNAELQKDNPSSTSVVVDKMIVNSVNKNIVMVIGAKRNHFISEDGAVTFRRLHRNASIHSWQFHPTDSNQALLSTWTDECYNRGSSVGVCNHVLYTTRDLGRTFQKVADYVVQFGWGDKKLKLQDRIYFTHHRVKTGEQPRSSGWSAQVDFAYTDDYGRTSHLLITQGNKFLVSNGYIFVAKLADAARQTVNMYVSTDGGSSFSQAMLPTEIQEKSYTILDTSEGAIMLHVNHGENNGGGSVYISDEKGIRYSLSLPNNIRNSGGGCEFDKVLSLEGVYIANFRDVPEMRPTLSDEDLAHRERYSADEDLEDDVSLTAVDRRRKPKNKGKATDVIRTVISFDKGGIWSYLRPPKIDSKGQSIPCAEKGTCWLHLHGITNREQYAPFYSVENAVGIIIATGNIGMHLKSEPDEVNTYMSRDGGLTWVEAHKGAYVYEFGDHGGLTVMADDVLKTKQVVFSWNEGQSWYDFELGNLPVEVDNIVIEPNSTSVEFLLYGTRDDVGVLYHLDFNALGQPKCNGAWAADSVSSDYEHWSPSDGRKGEKCILGRSITYTRRKQTSECFNGPEFSRPISRKNCACTPEDFECEFGFTRKVGSYECKPEDPRLTAEGCTTSSYFYADAYRKVPGDTCEGGWTPTKVAVPCPAHAPFSRGAKVVLSVILAIAALMFIITYLSRSPRVKHLFKNYGFESFQNVGYSVLGGRMPETAVDMSSCKYEPELGFIDSEQDEHEEDAPTLMSYSADRFSSSSNPSTAASVSDRSNRAVQQFDLERDADDHSRRYAGTGVHHGRLDTSSDNEDMDNDASSDGIALNSSRSRNPTTVTRRTGASSSSENIPRIPPPGNSANDFGTDGLELI